MFSVIKMFLGCSQDVLRIVSGGSQENEFKLEAWTLIIFKSTEKPLSSMFLFRGGKIRLCVCHA